MVICTLGNLQAVIFLTCESIDINLITEVIKKARTHSHFMATSLVYEGQHRARGKLLEITVIEFRWHVGH